MFDSFKPGEKLGSLKRLQCGECRRMTIHTLEAQCIGEWEDGDSQYIVDGGTEFSLYRCGACDDVIFEKSSWCSEDFDHDENGNTFQVRTDVLFPPPIASSFTFNTAYTPHPLNEIIEEMLYALAGGKMRLSTVGLRMIVEFIVNDKECSGRGLMHKINDLRAKGLIDEGQKDLLHKIRLKGNSGAHRGLSMSTTELVAGMSVVDLLIEKLYSAPKRQDEVMQKAKQALGDKEEAT